MYFSLWVKTNKNALRDHTNFRDNPNYTGIAWAPGKGRGERSREQRRQSCLPHGVPGPGLNDMFRKHAGSLWASPSPHPHSMSESKGIENTEINHVHLFADRIMQTFMRGQSFWSNWIFLIPDTTRLLLTLKLRFSTLAFSIRTSFRGLLFFLEVVLKSLLKRFRSGTGIPRGWVENWTDFLRD